MTTFAKNLSFFMALGLTMATGANAASESSGLAPDFMDKLDSDERPLEDRLRDPARRPYQVMQVLGVEEGMTVVDFHSGAGWYTEVLSAAVGDSGTVIAQFGPRGGDAQRQRAERLGNVEPVFADRDEIEDGVADRAVTALSIHHMDEEEGVAFMEDIYRVLKQGGMAAVIDHEGSAGMNNEELHRIQKSRVRDFIEQTDLEIVADSDLLHTNADDHSMVVFAPELERNTDRFLFIVQKP